MAFKGSNIGFTGAIMSLLECRHLSVRFRTARGELRAVDDVSFSLDRGQCLALVGESGSGKTQTCLALAGLLSDSAIVEGSVRFEGEELLGAGPQRWNRLRGRRIAMIFQDPMTALTPHLTVGSQLCELLRVHEQQDQISARRRALEIMERVRIADPERRFSMYPFELSGGMRQRIMIALALILKPALVLADEPTTALDVTVQADVLGIFRAVIEHTGTAMLLVTHDLGVVAGTCDQVMVMYAGRTLESAPVESLFASPRHPYSRALLDCIPRSDQPRSLSMPAIEGQPPDLAALPSGCAFAPRCAYVQAKCTVERPLIQSSNNGQVACWYPLPSSNTARG